MTHVVQERMDYEKVDERIALITQLEQEDLLGKEQSARVHFSSIRKLLKGISKQNERDTEINIFIGDIQKKLRGDRDGNITRMFLQNKYKIFSSVDIPINTPMPSDSTVYDKVDTEGDNGEHNIVGDNDILDHNAITVAVVPSMFSKKNDQSFITWIWNHRMKIGTVSVIFAMGGFICFDIYKHMGVRICT
jgi:hypothetical protein